MNSINTTVYDFQVDPDNELGVYAWILRFTAGARALLEIGCSTGFLSRHLAARGSRVVGVERNPAAAAQARAACVRVIVGDILAPEVQAQVREKFDVVLLGDVLEHLPAPGALLETIRTEWLAPGGRVVLSVPNSGHWVFRREVLGGRFPYQPYGLFDATHLRFFTRTSLQALVAESGYVVERTAFSVNYNSVELTFATLAPLYARPRWRSRLLRLEHALATVWPALFAYQFVLSIRPEDSR